MNGPKGKRGPIASCPMCGEGATGITWDAELDVCTCGNCGWTNGSENLDLYPTAPGPKAPMTNAQKIRAMTDEEMVEFIMGTLNCDVYECGECPFCGPVEKILDWLQQPVKEGAEQWND